MSLPIFIQWAGASTNYSSGPDNGFPVEVTPGFVFWTPGVSLPAQSLNYVVGTLSRAAAVIPSTAINTWSPALTANTMSSGSTTLDLIAWDDVNKVWVSASHSTGEYSLSVDDGINWIDLGALPGQTDAIIPLPSGGGYSLPQGGTTNIQFGNLQGAVTDTGTHLSATAIHLAAGFPHAASGLAVGFLQDSTLNLTKAYTTPDGTTITDVSASLPGPWGAGPQGAMSYMRAALGPAKDACVSLGTTVAGTGNSQLLHVTWTGSALVYTNVTVPLAVRTKSITGVAYNATLGLWGLMTYDGTNSLLYTSPDLVTFTAQAAPAGFAGGLAAVGPYWVTSIEVPYGSGINRWRAFASLDGNSFTGLGSPYASVFSVASYVVAGDGSVGMYSVQGAAVSKRCG
jgi:hypothetical protein